MSGVYNLLRQKRKVGAELGVLLIVHLTFYFNRAILPVRSSFHERQHRAGQIPDGDFDAVRQSLLTKGYGYMAADHLKDAVKHGPMLAI